jgi:hypothetical protein
VIVCEGNRHRLLTKIAFAICSSAQSMSRSQMLAFRDAMRAINKSVCDPPKTDDQIDRISRDAIRKVIK